jgi:hypothetical protein
MGMKRDDWLELYEHAVSGDHNFLYFNIQKPKRLRCMQNFDKVLFFDETPVASRVNEEVNKT